VRRADAEKSLCRDHERPQIEAAFAAGDPGLVDLHEFVDSLQEDRFRQLGQGHPHRGLPETTRVLVGPEQRDAAIAELVGLEPLEDFLAVVEHSSRRIE